MKPSRSDKQADKETTAYVVWRAPLETPEQWVERCKPLRARSSTIILRPRQLATRTKPTRG
jgi:hypothetical protein